MLAAIKWFKSNYPCKSYSNRSLIGDGGGKWRTGYSENIAAPEVAQPEWDGQMIILVLPSSWKKDNDHTA
jgi:hypothetical protein